MLCCSPFSLSSFSSSPRGTELVVALWRRNEKKCWPAMWPLIPSFDIYLCIFSLKYIGTVSILNLAQGPMEVEKSCRCVQASINFDWEPGIYSSRKHLPFIPFWRIQMHWFPRLTRGAQLRPSLHLYFDHWTKGRDDIVSGRRLHCGERVRRKRLVPFWPRPQQHGRVQWWVYIHIPYVCRAYTTSKFHPAVIRLLCICHDLRCDGN